MNKRHLKNSIAIVIVMFGLLLPGFVTKVHAIVPPDLIITAVTITPAVPAPNQTFTVSITVKNQGGSGTGAIVYGDVFIGNALSDFIGVDGCFLNDQIDYYSKGDLNSALDPNQQTTIVVSVPGGFASGVHRVFAYTDGECLLGNPTPPAIPEVNKSNNSFGPITVAVSPTFVDVPYTGFGWAHIESIYQAHITGGCLANPLSYCPGSPVTRAQMAVFLLRSIHGSSYTPPAVGGSSNFADVPITYWAAAWIKQLAVEGITGGCSSGNYCPDNTVTRDQMAVFLLKAKHGTSYAPPSLGGSTGFVDVPTTYWSASWIKQLAAEGITGGCSSGNYCPTSPVTRAQMAIFLQRTFGLALPTAP